VAEEFPLFYSRTGPPLFFPFFGLTGSFRWSATIMPRAWGRAKKARIPVGRRKTKLGDRDYFRSYRIDGPSNEGQQQHACDSWKGVFNQMIFVLFTDRHPPHMPPFPIHSGRRGKIRCGPFRGERIRRSLGLGLGYVRSIKSGKFRPAHLIFGSDSRIPSRRHTDERGK